MKRNWETIRTIFRELEADNVPMVNPDQAEETYYHLKLLVEGGYIVAAEVANKHFINPRFTWQGWELQEFIRDDKRWIETKRILEDLNCYSIDVIKDIVRRRVGV